MYEEYCPGALSPFPLTETRQGRLGVSVHLSLPWELDARLWEPQQQSERSDLLAVPSTPERRWIFGGGSEQNKC